MSQRLYEVTVSGEYYTKAANGSAATVMSYNEVFILPSLDKALSVIKGKLLDGKLKQRYANYETYRTHSVTDIGVADGAVDKSVVNVPLAELTLKQLDDYCIVNRIFCDVYKEGSLSAARQLVQKLVNEQAERFNASADTRKMEAEENELRKLNAMNLKRNGVELPGTSAAPSLPKKTSKAEVKTKARTKPKVKQVLPEEDKEPLPAFLDDGKDACLTSEAEG